MRRSCHIITDKESTYTRGFWYRVSITKENYDKFSQEVEKSGLVQGKIRVGAYILTIENKRLKFYEKESP